jgi:hypothetical protein
VTAWPPGRQGGNAPLATMPLRAITSVHGEGGLRERRTQETSQPTPRLLHAMHAGFVRGGRVRFGSRGSGRCESLRASSEVW